MKKGVIAIIVIAGALLIGVIIWLAVSLNKSKSEKDALADQARSAQQTVAPAPSPCADTAQMRLDAEAADKAAADAAKDAKAKNQALKNAIRKCQPNFANGDTSYVIIINQQTGTTGNKSNNRSTDGNQQKSSTTKPGQQVSSSYEGADKPAVVQNYKQSSAGAQQFVWNIQADANGRPNGDKYWPHLENAANPAQYVPEAVSNGQRGYNVSMPSVPPFSTSYGYNLEEKVGWNLCNILDNPKFGGCTNVILGGDFTGWQWLPATIENVGGKSYYVVRW